MNLAISAAVFPVIFLGELPDKTMIASLVLSTRGRALSVWLGAAAAFAIHVVLAATVGVVVFRLLPHRVVEIAVAVIFLAGAVITAREAIRGRHEPHPPAPAGEDTRAVRRTAATSFAVIFVAEWGDLTQLLIANLTARFHSPLSVGLGALLALWAVTGLAVIGGRGLLRMVNVTFVRWGTVVLLAALAGYSGWIAFS